MRTTRVVSSLLLLLGAACSTDLDDVTADFFTTGVNTLRVEIYDGLTGVPVEGATLTIQVGPRLITAEAQGNEYLAERLPGGTFTVSVNANGFLDFLGSVSLSGGTPTSNFRNFFNRTLFVYPEGQAPNDLTVRVFENDAETPVSGARVFAGFNQNATPTNQTSFQVISPSSNTVGTTLTADTDANGTATFAAASLILGANYDIEVFGAVTSDGRFLSSETTSFEVGDDFPTILLFLDEPAETPVALSASNDEGGPEFQNELVVRFPYAVEVCSNPDDHNGAINGNSTAPYDAADDDGDTTFNSLNDDMPVTVTPSEENTVLTFTFNLDGQDDLNQTDLDGNNDSLNINFLGFEISPVGSRTCTALTSVPVRQTGRNLDTDIDVR